MKTLSVVNPCFNEEGNVRELYERVRAVMNRLGRYRYEHIFIDNSSADRTAADSAGTRGLRPQRKGHCQHAELRPYPLAVPCHAAGARRRRHLLASDLQDPRN